MSAKFDFSTLGKPFEADWPATISEPVDGGAVRESVLMCRFRQLSKDELEALMAQPDFDFLTIPRAYFIGFGKDVDQAWSIEIRDKLLGLPNVRTGITEAYTAFTNGVAAKNSKTSPG